MAPNPVLLTVGSSLLSGLLGVAISTWYHRRAERRRLKLDALVRFFSNRYDLKGDEFSRALNQIFVVFNDSEPVKRALAAFHGDVTGRGASEDSLIKLSKAMCANLGIRFDDFNDSFFLKPFNTRSSSVA